MTLVAGSPLVFQAGAHKAQKFREFLKSFVPVSGVDLAGSCKVKQRVVNGQGCLVSAGGIFLVGSSTSTTQGTYYDYNDADLDVPAPAAHATLSRIDRLVYRVFDPDYVGGTDLVGDFEWIQGTAAASPTAPTVPVDSYSLAQVLRAANNNTIVNANITDERSVALFETALGADMLFTLIDTNNAGSGTFGTIRFQARRSGGTAVDLFTCSSAGTMNCNNIGAIVANNPDFYIDCGTTGTLHFRYNSVDKGTLDSNGKLVLSAGLTTGGNVDVTGTGKFSGALSAPNLNANASVSDDLYINTGATGNLHLQVNSVEQALLATAGLKVTNGFSAWGHAVPGSQPAAISSPASDTSGTKAAIDAIRSALTGCGITA